MSSDEKKKWGTIFLDAARESSLSKLDAMQAASRQEQWNQKTQQDYLERVRQKAIDRAREILGEAYTERQSVLDEAEKDAERIRSEAKAAYASADETRKQTQTLRHSVQAELDNATHLREGAKEEGFQHGLAAAEEELNNFRMAMGSSVAGILRAIETQCMNIFEGWRADLVELFKVSVEKGTGLVLSERHNDVLKKMILEAVRNLDDRRMVTLRVHPDDEEVVADLFNAAKEKNPDLGHWRIASDAGLELGDIIAESQTGTVDSRLHLYREMVDNILQHLVLPPSQVDEKAQTTVSNTVEDVVNQVMNHISQGTEIADSSGSVQANSSGQEDYSSQANPSGSVQDSYSPQANPSDSVQKTASAQTSVAPQASPSTQEAPAPQANPAWQENPFLSQGNITGHTHNPQADTPSQAEQPAEAKLEDILPQPNSAANSAQVEQPAEARLEDILPQPNFAAASALQSDSHVQNTQQSVQDFAQGQELLQTLTNQAEPPLAAASEFSTDFSSAPLSGVASEQVPLTSRQAHVPVGEPSMAELEDELLPFADVLDDFESPEDLARAAEIDFENEHLDHNEVLASNHEGAADLHEEKIINLDTPQFDPESFESENFDPNNLDLDDLAAKYPLEGDATDTFNDDDLDDVLDDDQEVIDLTNPIVKGTA